MTPPPPAALRSVSAAAVRAAGSPAAGVSASGGAHSLPIVDALVFRQALARHPAGVTLRGPAGLTVTSFISASLDPPLMPFYIGHGSAHWAAVREAGHFAVNLADHGQEVVAAGFARKGADRFGPGTQCSPGPGEVGRVDHAIIGSGEPPLLHHQGRSILPEPGTRDDR